MHPRCKPENGMTKSYIFFSLDHCYKCTLNTFQARFVFISINPCIKSKHLFFHDRVRRGVGLFLF